MEYHDVLSYISLSLFLHEIWLEEELIMWIMKTSITQIWMVCHLLPFAKVGQNTGLSFIEVLVFVTGCVGAYKTKT